MSIDRAWRMAAIAFIGGLIVAGCAGEADEAAVLEQNEDVMTAPSQATGPAEPAAAQPQTIAEIFPAGEGRDIVLNNCASCHAVACAAIGQRPVPRWEELREAHAEHVPSLSAEQRQTAFAYLAEHFSAEDPEPNVPPQFLERGCTPF